MTTAPEGGEEVGDECAYPSHAAHPRRAGAFDTSLGGGVRVLHENDSGYRARLQVTDPTHCAQASCSLGGSYRGGRGGPSGDGPVVELPKSGQTSGSAEDSG